MKVIDFLESTYKDNAYNVRPFAICKDGFKISIQGGTESHYCIPRKLCHEYIKVELGFPSESDDLIFEFAEDNRDLLGTVYGYVPIEIVEKLIEKHGGIDPIMIEGNI